MRKLKVTLILILILTSNPCLSQVTDSLENAIGERFKSVMTGLNKELSEFKGKHLPEFELTLLDGKKLSSESLKGKPTLINLWFSNCQPCIDEMPILNDIKSQLYGEVNFISITFQDHKAVTEFLNRVDYNFTHIIDAKEYLKSFGFFGYPKTLILDKDLVITEIEKFIPKDIENEVKNKAEFKNRIIHQLTELKKR
ncbi:TlpA family protein disulfide reductase [Sediminicola sp. 1XM1-17]|uniref:TlpA family protein disulfide reductase n=1 Tax=Sediminicola sp. 1XM1-17 TaxID=3127702 RepID=UPI003077DBC1